jgi:hypothetical protein
MLLLEIIVGKNKKIAKSEDAFWVMYRMPKINFYPKYSNSRDRDLFKFFGGDPDSDDYTSKENKTAQRKVSAAMAADYDKPNSSALFYVESGVVHFDMSKITGTSNRRKDIKMDDPKSHDKRDRAKEVPILGGEVSFKRIVDMQKCLMALVKVKPATADYQIKGDDRVRGMTVQEVIDGGAEKYDHRRAFTGKVQSLTLFHGTSMRRAGAVLKTGLRPSQRGSVYSDMINGYSQKNVYLASSAAEAANYATREAVNDGSEAAVLEVTLTPMMVMKLLPDEDTMHWFKYLGEKYRRALLAKYPMLSQIWSPERVKDGFDVHIKNMHHSTQRYGLSWLFDDDDRGNEFRVHARTVLKKYGYTSKNIVELEKELYVAIMNTFIQANATKSLKTDGVTAYPGTVPASQIKLVKTWDIKGGRMKADPDKEAYAKATDAVAKTVQYH